MPEGVKSAAASVARNINKVLNAVGAGLSPTLDFYGHPFSHPLVEEYFSQCPVRFGDHVAKIGAFPVAAEQKALADWQLDSHQDEDGFRHAAVDYFEGNDAVFELRAQLWTDAETQPIEDTSVDWPMSESPYRTIATIRLPQQSAYRVKRATGAVLTNVRRAVAPAHYSGLDHTAGAGFVTSKLLKPMGFRLQQSDPRDDIGELFRRSQLRPLVHVAADRVERLDLADLTVVRNESAERQVQPKAAVRKCPRKRSFVGSNHSGVWSTNRSAPWHCTTKLLQR